jgi:Putative zinc-finger
MKCAEVRKLVQLYIDSELDAKHSLEVEQHLESCLECAGLFDAEKKFDERLRRFLRKGPRTVSLWGKIESQIGAASPVSRTLFSTWWISAAAAAVLLFAAGLFWVKAQPLDLAKAAGQCHSAYLQGLASPEFKGAVPPEIEKDFAGKLDVAAFTYHPSATRFTSRGARFCQIANVPCALTMGDYDKIPVSVIVFEKTRLAQFPQARHRLDSGDSVVCSRAGRYHFAMRVMDSHVVCIVAEAPEKLVEDLAKSVINET